MIHRKLVKKHRSYRLLLSLPPLALAMLLIQKSMVTDEIIYKSPEQSSLQEKTGTAWKTEYRLDESKNAYLQGRPNFASEILVQISSPFYHYQRVAEEAGRGEDEAWFIYSVSTDASGAKLSANKCASLLSHNITKCVMVGLNPEALKWWKDNEHVLPGNAIYYDATHAFQWAYEWNQREHSSAALKAYFLKPMIAKNYETLYRHIQSVILARTFIFVDMLHLGYNVWMLDSDVVFPLDPKDMFLDPNLHCVYMLNLGQFYVGDHNEMAYSYPFLTDGSHATVNNGIVASRSTPQTLKLWVMSVDRMLNHVSGDPQHPHNQLLYVLGLRLKKVLVAGYPDLEGKFGYYEDTGTAAVHILNEGVAQALPLRIRAIFTISAYDQAGLDVLNQQVAIHAVGVGGMGSEQNKKCRWLKGIGFWFIESAC